MAPERGVHRRSGNLAWIAMHLLAVFRSFGPCEQPLLFADRPGHRHTSARRVGGNIRHDQRRNCPSATSEAAARPDLAPWRNAVRPRLDLSRGDFDSRDLNREIRRVVALLPCRNCDSGDRQQLRPRAR